MAVRDTIHGWLSFLKRLARYRNVETTKLMFRYRFGSELPLTAKGRLVTIDPPGITIDLKRNAYYVERVWVLRDLVQGEWTFVMNENGVPEYRAGKARIVPEGRDDLIMLHETFGDQIYQVFDDREHFVWDVGMNVAVVALYFAGVRGWEVLGYEPIPTTFEIARRNVERSGLTDRIHMRNAGVDGKAGRLEIAFNKEARSTNSLFGNLWEERPNPDGKVEIELVDAADALEEALTLAGDRPIFAKIDCEGAEYAIFDRLIERGLLDKVETYILEYHLILPEHTLERLSAPLVERGYAVRELWKHPHGHVGGLMAAKDKNLLPKEAASSSEAR